ncbi:MAG: radical SAM protein [Deltaproteobacteria bacterium]|nr:radical SAM protein [Deltaproteobacteria bacterium]
MLQISELLRSAIATNSVNNIDVAQQLRDQAKSRFLENQPPVVVWNVNHSCNMTCPHCYASAKLKPEFDGVSTEEALSIIDKLHHDGINIIIFSGGEPLMRSDLIELIRYATAKRLSCHLSTNGTLITPPMAASLKSAGIRYVGVSLDGLEEFNDKHRGLKGGFKLAWEGILNAKNAGLATGLRMTLTAANEHYLFSLLDLAVEQEIPRFYVSHLVYSGRAKSYARYDLDNDRSRQITSLLFKRAVDLLDQGKKISIVTGGNDVDGVLLYKFVWEQFGKERAELIYGLLTQRGGNSAGEKIINIDHKGNVHPDQFWQTTDCGNILDKSLSEILKSPLIERLREREKYLTGKCKGCIFIKLCRGSHRERALAATGDMWAPDPACYLSEDEISLPNSTSLIDFSGASL